MQGNKCAYYGTEAEGWFISIREILRTITCIMVGSLANSNGIKHFAQSSHGTHLNFSEYLNEFMYQCRN